MTLSPTRDAPERWASATRIAPLPERDGAAPPAISFAFFPPKTPALEAQLCIRSAPPAKLRPNFVSVTYGARGGTHERTHATMPRIVQEPALPPAGQLRILGVKPQPQAE